MVKGDIFTSPINFAIQEMLKRFENSENDNDKALYQIFKRSEAIWETIQIHGLEIIGMTYEEFTEQCKEKKHIVFLSDDEVADFNKAIEIMNIMRRN